MERIEQSAQKTASSWQRFMKRETGPDMTKLSVPAGGVPMPVVTGGRRLEFADPWRLIWAGLLIVAIFFGGGAIWASIAKLSGAIIFQGVVKVEAERKVVQHLEGGIIKEILVKNGDHVNKDQPLVVLESSRISSAVDQLQAQYYANLASAARLTAEKDMATAIAFPAELKTPQGRYVSADVEALVEAETKIFVSQRTALRDQEALIANQIEQIEEQIKSLNERVKAQDAILAATEEELKAKQVLYEGRFLDKSVILQLQRSKAESGGVRGQFVGAIAEAREKIASMKLQGVSIRNKYVETATEKLGETQKLLLDLRERLRPLEDARQRLDILAPIGGVVVGLNVHSVGGVLGPGQSVLEIVPEDSPLVVEGKIQLADIAKVSKGQKTDVQLLAFDHRSTPKIPAKVSYISADRVAENSPMGPQSFYNVQVEVDQGALKDAGLYLTPGMPATVYVLTKERTVLDYALEPLIKSANLAMREH